MAKLKLTYSEAYTELLQIAAALENNELPLETLSAKVKRADELIEYCKNKLREVEDQVTRVFDKTEEQS